jgi:hypothetical protein
MDVVILLPGEGERIAAGASTAVMKATAETTGGAFSMSEATFPAGMNGPPPHAHRYTTDTFYVLEGTLHMTVGDSEIDASPGSYILVLQAWCTRSPTSAKSRCGSSTSALLAVWRSTCAILPTRCARARCPGAQTSRQSSRITISWSRHRARSNQCFNFGDR